MSEELEAGKGASGYLAYMLRLRQVVRDGRPVWLASLESALTGERHAFASLELLYAFVDAETAGASLGRARDGVPAELAPVGER